MNRHIREELRRAFAVFVLCGILVCGGSTQGFAQPASPPTATAATGVTTTSFDANWAPTGGETGYRLDVATDAGFTTFVGGYNDLDVLNVLTFPVTGLMAGTTYHYRLRGYDGIGTNLVSSNAITVTTLPLAPVATPATAIAQTTFSANWNTTAGATGYRLDVATDAGFSSFVSGFSSLDVGLVLTTSVTGLTANTPYWYRLRAYNTGGTSGNSNVINPTTLPGAPGAPVATPATAIAQTTFSANWNTTAGATGYRLDVATDAGFSSFVSGFSNLDVGLVLTTSVTGLTANTPYWYRLRAYNTGGTSGNSNVINPTTLPGAPGAPVATPATAIAQTTFSANWNTTAGATGYRLDVATDAGFSSFVSGFSNLDVGLVLTTSVTGLTANTPYWYRVRAYNTGGTSGNSNVINPTTLPGAPGAPVATPATAIAQTTFSANWNTTAGATGYRLDVATDAGFSSFVSGFSNLDVGLVLTTSVTGLTANTPYWYRVRAYNTGGTSGNSNVINPTTLPGAPGAPVASAATLITQTSFSANWNTTAGATGYRLDVATDAGFSSFVSGFSSLDVGLVLTTSVTGLTANTPYWYRVRAYNTGGTSGNSNVINPTTLPGAPGAPVATPATAIAQTTFSANWNTTAGATGYRLDVATDAGFSSFVSGFSNLDVGLVLTTSVTGLTANTPYWYRLRAYNTGGTSGNSNVINPTTLPGAPGAPVATPATAIAQTTFSANWNTTAGATGYRLDVATDAGFSSFVSGFSNLDVGLVLTTSVTGLTANTPYWYRVRAYNTGGTSGNSNVINPTTLPGAPGAPVASAATLITQTSFSANWNTTAGATGYRLDVATDAGFSSFVSGFSSLDVGLVLTTSVTGLTANTPYWYRVRAYNTGGTSGNSNVINPTTLPGAPGAPVATPATAIAQTTFSANWNTTAGATGYRLDVATDAGFSSFVAGFNNHDAGNLTTISVTGLSAETAYWYRIRAYNTGGTSGNSNVINPTTLPGAPGAPVATAASAILQTSFNANWNTVAGATGYRLDVATDVGFSAFVAGFNNLDVGLVLTRSVTGLTANTPYWYRVRAYNTGGTSGNSNAINPTTLPNAPGVPVATAATAILQTSFTANWSVTAGATGYRLDVATDAAFTAFVGVNNNRDVGNVTTISVTGLTANTPYWYRLRAYNTGGTSGNSNSINPTTLPNAPGAPVATAATLITQTSFVANWGVSAGATGYRLDVATDAGFTSFVGIYNDRDVGNVLTISVSGLTANTPYFYRVRAYNTGGASASSNVINPTTLPNAPGAPTATSATALNQTSFSANWNSSPGATGYRLDVSTDPGFSTFVGLNNNRDVLNVTTFSVTGLASSTTYYYRVRAYNTGGTSGNSNTISQLTITDTPTATAASNIAQTSLNANWGSVAGASGYRLDVATDSLFTTFVGSYNNFNVGSLLTLSVTGLTASTRYHYRVRSYNAAGTSPSSNVISTTTLPNAPGVPTATAATNIALTSFSANWTTAAGATGYRLDVATDAGFSSFVAGFNDRDVLTATTFSVTGLTAGTQYFYRVRATNAGGTTANSNTISTATLPAAPVATAASAITGISFSANWNVSTGATGYRLDVATDAGFTAFVGTNNNLDVSNVTTFSVTGLTPGTPYFYRVRAYNAGGTSTNSNTINPTTLSSAPVATAATAITQTSFSANWNVSAGATSYRLDVATDVGFTTFFGVYNDLNVGNVLTQSVTGLTAGTTYYYRVRAVNAGGTTGNSNVITTPTLPATAVATAATLVTQTSFSANWNVANGATGYRLDVATDAGFATFVATFNNRDVSNVTTFSVTGLSASTPYYYRVRAYNGSGIGGNSNVINPTTLPNVPGAPVATAATLITQTSFSANWNVSAAATGYRLDVSTDAGFAALVTGYNDRDVLNVTTFSVTGLTANTPYYYRVRAYNTGGASANSNAINPTTLPSAPGAPVTIAATTILQTSFSANWNAAAGATGYRLDVATDAGFTAFVSGFNNRDVLNVTTFSITGLAASTPYFYRVRSYNAGGTSANSNATSATTLTPVVITTTSPLPNATAGTFYSTTISATGGTAPYTWNVNSGLLPGGMSLAAPSGIISGIPTASGTSNFTLRVIDAVNSDTTTRAFALTVLAGVPANIALGTGDLQATAVATAFSTALTATVTDGLGNPVPNVTVTFTSPSTGANGTFTGSVHTVGAQTNASGVATAPTFTANTVSGSYSDTASISTGAFVVYRLTNNPGAANKVRVETLANGTGIIFAQNVTSGSSVTVYPIVRDQYDNFIGNQTATWTLAVTGGVNRNDLVPANGVSATSATFTGAAVGTARITAVIAGTTSVPSGLFSVVIAGVPTKILVETAVDGTGVVFPDSGLASGRSVTVYAIARDNANNFVRNIPSFWSLVNATGNIQRTDLSAPIGVYVPNATFTAHAIGTVRMQADSGAITGTQSGTITVRAGNPAAITATGGTGQSAQINTPFATRLAATVFDSSGNPVPGRQVTFSVPSLTGPSGTFAGGVNTATTNSSGVATASVFTANSRAGAYTDTARVVGVTAPALFVLTNTSGTAATLTPRPGTTPQHVPVGSSTPVPLAVLVLDAPGNPVPGVSVTFTAPNTPASGFPKSQAISSDADGVATLPQYQANAISGPDTVVATAVGVTTPAKFILTNDPGLGQSFFATLGAGQSAVVKTRFVDSLQARATDGPNGTGNGVPGILVTFTSPPSGARVFFRRTGTQVDTVRTNPSGYATSSAITADSVAGTYAVVASAAGVSSVPFALTNIAAGATKFSIEAYPVSGIIGKQLATVPFDVIVTARDAYNNASTILASPDSINITSNAPLLSGGGVFPFSGTTAVQTIVFRQSGNPDTIKVARVGGPERGFSNGFAVENPVPNVTAVLPPNARKGQTVDVTITGSGFLPPQISIPLFGPYFTVNSWTVVNSTQISVNMLVKAGAPDSSYDVTVFNPGPGGGSGVLKQGFTVGQTPRPNITSLNSSTGARLSTFNLIVRGSGFFGGVTSVDLGPGTRVNSTTVDSVNQLTANVTINAGAALGPRNLIVINTVPPGTGGGVDTLKNGFTIVNPVPTLTDVAQKVGSRLGTLSLVFTGSNFIPGCTVSFGDTGMVINSAVVDTGFFQQIAVRVTILPEAFLGLHTASVTSPGPGGGTSNLADGFTVLNPVPTLSALLPNSAGRQATLDVIMKGTNFVRGSTRVFFRDGITVNSLRVDSSTQMTANLTISSLASLGGRTVVAYNPAPGGDSSGTEIFTVTPPSSPVPVLAFPPNANGFQATSLRLIWSASAGANGYVVQVSKAPNGTFQPVDSTISTSDTTTLIGPLTLNARYYWRVASTNAQGATSAFSAPWNFTAAYPARVTMAVTVPFPTRAAAGDYLQSDYRLVGLPGSSAVPVEKYLPGASETDWRVIWDNGNATSYWIPFSSGPTFTYGSGRAFWVIHKGNVVVADSVLSAPLDNGGNAIIPLHGGWNIITNPLGKPVRWSDITSANPPTRPEHRLSGYQGGFRDTTYLLPYEGFYFENTDNLPSLKIPYSIGAGPQAAKVSVAGIWTMRINLSAGLVIDRVAKLGVSPDARKGKDSLDGHRPMVFDGIPMVVFNRPEWDASSSAYGSDYRPLIEDLESWEFEVRTKLRTPVRLDIDGASAIPDRFASYVIDTERARSLDLKTGSVYTFTPATDVSRFTLVVGRPEKVREQLDAMLPREFALGNNFPNPFNPETTIPVSIPRAGEINLTVYNVLGEEVRTLYAGSLEAGKYWFRWDGRSERGNSVASGVYFARLSTGAGMAFVQKMTLLK